MSKALDKAVAEIIKDGMHGQSVASLARKHRVSESSLRARLTRQRILLSDPGIRETEDDRVSAILAQDNGRNALEVKSERVKLTHIDSSAGDEEGDSDCIQSLGRPEKNALPPALESLNEDVRALIERSLKAGAK